MSRIVNYTVIDLEMTGLNPKNDKILEIGAVKVRNQKIVKKYSVLVNPMISVPERITEITGITTAMVEDGVEMDDAVKGLLEFIGEDIIVGQNVIFDYSFIKQWAINNKITIRYLALDTLKMARRLLPPEQSKKLEALCEYFQIERVNGHRALDDSIQTYHVYEKLCDLCDETKSEGFEPKELIYKAKRQTPATKHQIERLKEYMQLHDIKDELPWESLTRSQASRTMDQYLSKYGR